MTYFVAFLLAIVSSGLMDNVVLSRFYGICSFVGVGNKIKSAFSMGLAVSFVIILASLVCWPLYHYLLVPAGLPYLDTLVYILVIASLVQLVALFIRKKAPSLHKSLGLYLPLITTNCAVLGVAQGNTDSGLDFLMSMANAIGTSLGYLLVIVLFAALRERLESDEVPGAFKGLPIALISAALMAIAFMGLQGLV